MSRRIGIALLLGIVSVTIVLVVVFQFEALTTTDARKSADPCGSSYYDVIPDIRACLQTEIPLILASQDGSR